MLNLFSLTGALVNIDMCKTVALFVQLAYKISYYLAVRIIYSMLTAETMDIPIRFILKKV
jgi:hypothetical protein